MDLWTENFYGAWRENCQALNVLREVADQPPEKLLQLIWLHQRLRREQLRTVDGRAIRVLHPGFLSVEGGPDFRGAVVQLANDPPVTGDVEVDLVVGGWRAHGHDRNPHFKGVILQVVWDEPAGEVPEAGHPVVLPIKSFLDASLTELTLALEHDSGLPEAWQGRCSAPLRALAPADLQEILHAAARVRFENKAKALLGRARAAGWEQALWEQLFRALGYKNNVWPMLNLAETRQRWAGNGESAFVLQARLLGLSGLLPGELTRLQKTSDTYLKRAWDCWWRERETLANCGLPKELWHMHGLRPANHPQRRLALAAHWLAEGKLVARLEQWGAANLPEKEWGASLLEVFQVEADEFWSWHWTFKSARMVKPQPLLGVGRVTDLAVNVVLPWLWVRAREGGNALFQREMERRYQNWPAGEDNAVLKLTRQRLLGNASSRVLKGAADQQGLMQISRDFCAHADALCSGCQFPELVQNWARLRC